MKNTTVLDTNVILRYLLNDHPKYFQIASAFMQTIKCGEAIAYVPESVLAECVYVLLKVYKVPKSKVCDILIQFLKYQGINQENSSVLLDSLVLFSDHNVDIVDAIVYATARHHKWELVSFDKDFQKFLRK
ncbi:PIN domain-containing protein [Methylomonas sp. AM2-LC]|uniref:PIN domain-containing protein n=1 Tax=Methylomonas sp. AM2-LC TaxID=3153301 RepID=UPI003266EABC